MKRLLSFFALAALAISIAIPARAGDTAKGTWLIYQHDRNVQLYVHWRGANGDNSDHSSSVDPNALGVTQALESSGRHVKFRIDREAGSFVFDGWIGNGRGSGTFVFTANKGLFENLRSRGYDIDSIGKEMSAANLNITTAYVDGIEGQGLHGDFGQLISMKALGVTPAYVADLRGAGIDGLTGGAVISLRALHVDGFYVRDLASVGFSHLDAGQYISLKALGVNSAYIRYLQSHGLKNLTVGQVIAMKAEHI
jgi:hypothetical protein